MAKKIIALVCSLFFIASATIFSGCKGAIKSAVKSNFGKETAREAVSGVAGAALDNNNTKGDNSKKSSGKSGALVATGIATGSLAAVAESSNKNNMVSARDSATALLLSFHYNITRKNFRQAYECMDSNLQMNMPYKEWMEGFHTTISSTPSNIDVVSETSDTVVLTYKLQAVDNPGGRSYFKGKTIIKNTSAGWKIYDIVNSPL